MAQLVETRYKAVDFSGLTGLQGISDQQIAIHLGLYEGYVTNTNRLNEELSALIQSGASATPQYAEMTRRLGFEYSGMVLHEYYFGNLSSHGSAEPAPGSGALRTIEENFGSFAQWLADFQSVGKMRGVGWTVLFQDPANGRLSNHWITLHQDGAPAGFKPILVMDVWEHAFMVDYKPSERAKYIDAFFSNIDWDTVQARLDSPAALRPTA